MSDKIQTIENLSIGFKSQNGREVSILKDISTHINKGETVGIVGESGSGKSTLALAMMGYTKQGLYKISGQCLFKSKNFFPKNGPPEAVKYNFFISKLNLFEFKKL